MLRQARMFDHVSGSALILQNSKKLRLMASFVHCNTLRWGKTVLLEVKDRMITNATFVSPNFLFRWNHQIYWMLNIFEKYIGMKRVFDDVNWLVLFRILKKAKKMWILTKKVCFLVFFWVSNPNHTIRRRKSIQKSSFGILSLKSRRVNAW